MKQRFPDQSIEAYQRQLDIAARADAIEGIRQGLDDVAHGRTRPAREFFDEFRRKHGIPYRIEAQGNDPRPSVTFIIVDVIRLYDKNIGRYPWGNQKPSETCLFHSM
jgi:hypothetical protein